jgi:hypothetical protein
MLLSDIGMDWLEGNLPGQRHRQNMFKEVVRLYYGTWFLLDEIIEQIVEEGDEEMISDNLYLRFAQVCWQICQEVENATSN